LLLLLLLLLVLPLLTVSISAAAAAAVAGPHVLLHQFQLLLREVPVACGTRPL
jgi:hypothetical protein